MQPHSVATLAVATLKQRGRYISSGKEGARARSRPPPWELQLFIGATLKWCGRNLLRGRERGRTETLRSQACLIASPKVATQEWRGQARMKLTCNNSKEESSAPLDGRIYVKTGSRTSILQRLLRNGTATSVEVILFKPSQCKFGCAFLLQTCVP